MGATPLKAAQNSRDSASASIKTHVVKLALLSKHRTRYCAESAAVCFHLTDNYSDSNENRFLGLTDNIRVDGFFY